MQGLVTDVAIKRKIRNTVAWLGRASPVTTSTPKPESRLTPS
jgi:CRISPR/Cas system type I-B associated protein Csh2 (Cas7 group RAMP superfamily)